MTAASGSVRREIDHVRRSILSDLAIPCPIQARRRETGWSHWCHDRSGRMSSQGSALKLELTTPAIPLPERDIMANAIVMTGFGPPDVLKWAQVPLPEPG